jgi:adenylate kinase
VYWESEEKGKELRDEDFLTRHTASSKLEQRDLENEVLSACRIPSENDYGAVHPHKRSYVICPGLVYGMGEEYEKSLYHIFMKAWNYLPGDDFSIIGEGNNIVPTVHIKDLAKMIARVVVSLPNPRAHPYILAVDKAEEQTQEAIIQAIAGKMGIENVKKIRFAEVEKHSKELVYPLRLNLNMKIGKYLEGLMGDDWVSRNGLVQNIDEVFGELKEARGLRCVKAVLIGPPASGKTHFSNW